MEVMVLGLRHVAGINEELLKVLETLQWNLAAHAPRDWQACELFFRYLGI